METIIITGASKGIGFELAKSASESDLQVIAISRNISSLSSLPNCTVIQADISAPSFSDIIKAELNDQSVDYLINNAGLLINKPFSQLTDEDWNRQWNTNVLGPVRLIRSLIPNLSKDAHIVNISSMGGFQGSSKFAGLSAYSTTKGALSILSECLAEESDLKQVSINSLCLGAVQTEMLEAAFPGFRAPTTANEMAKFILKFTLEAGKLFSGKIIPVAKSNPT